LRAAGATALQVYERLTVEEIRRASSHLRRIYHNANGRDGYASIDLSQALTRDAHAIESEARHLWSVVDRRNLMIKIPAADAGLAAMRRLVAAGLNVNATLVFGARRYREVVDAYLLGLEDRVEAGLSLERVACVASVFLGHIDTAVNRELDAIQYPLLKAARAKDLRGRAGVAIAKFVYQRYKSVIASPQWQIVAAYRAKTQRLLWAGTHINDAGDSDLSYVNRLIGRDTVAKFSLDTRWTRISVTARQLLRSSEISLE
jgi:transaldolase